MSSAYVTLEEMLRARDERRNLQQQLLNTYHTPIVSFTMNIAGPFKRTPLVDFAFTEGLKRLTNQLPAPLLIKTNQSNTGCEALLLYEVDPKILKSTAVDIEEADDLGRLFDIDVLTPDGEKLSRSTPRRCLICGGPVQFCARSRLHSLQALQSETNRIIKNFICNRFADLAVAALLAEARLTPKPGLVDSANNGAHRDMDLPLLEASAEALRPFFFQVAQLGLEHPHCMSQLQKAGIAAEAMMFDVTNGVNTHKGALFSLGILCAAAAGNLMGYGDTFLLAANLARSIPPIQATNTHGEYVRKQYAAGGARNEAISGFPHVQSALSLLRSGISPLYTLLTLMSHVEDSNILWRGGLDGLNFIQEHSKYILAHPENERLPLITAFDETCIRKNLSPGGSADLLSAALFLYSLDM